MPCLKLRAVFMYCYIALLEAMDYPGGTAQGPATKIPKLAVYHGPFFDSFPSPLNVLVLSQING